MLSSNAKTPSPQRSLEEQTRHFRSLGRQQPRVRDRRALQAFLDDGRGTAPEPVVSLGALVRDAEAMRPQIVTALSDRMDALRDAWLDRDPDALTPTSEVVESILRPHLEAGVPLRRRGEGPSWAFGLLVGLLRTFDSSAMVVEQMASKPSKHVRSEGSVGTLARLATAAGWLSWSHLIVEPLLARAFLNVQLELIDRLDRQAHRDDAVITADDRAWATTALTLETRLHRHLATPPPVLH